MSPTPATSKSAERIVKSRESGETAASAHFPERLFAVASPVTPALRSAPLIEFVHCNAVHYVSTRPLPRGEPLDHAWLVVVCGACPVPRLGLPLTCHACSAPLEAREQGGRLLGKG